MSKSNVMHDESEMAFTVKERKSNVILKMVNFKTYAEATITIPQGCTTLVSGASGDGKTTIMEFFAFVFYDGTIQPERHDTKRCWGWIIFNDIVVYRQKDPKLLKVWINDLEAYSKMGEDTKIKTASGQEYTGDEAQYVINKRFGTLNVFLATSYLRQKEFSILLTGTDAEKLDIMKEITSKNGEFDNLKDPIKKYMLQCESQAIATQAQFKQALETAQNFDRQHGKLNLNISEIPEDPTITMQKVRTLRSEQDMLRSSYAQAVQKETKLSMIKNEIDKTKNIISSWQSRLSAFKDRNLDEEMATLKLEISSLSNNNDGEQKKILLDIYKRWADEKLNKENKFQNSKASLSKILDTMGKVLDNPEIKLENLEKSKEWMEAITKKIEKWEEYKTVKQNYEQLLRSSNFGRLEDLQEIISKHEKTLQEQEKTVEEITKTIEEHRKNQWWDCPSCEASLIMSADGKNLQLKNPEEKIKIEKDISKPASNPLPPSPTPEVKAAPAPASAPTGESKPPVNSFFAQKPPVTSSTPAKPPSSLFAQKPPVTPTKPPTPPASNDNKKIVEEIKAVKPKKEAPVHVPCKYNYDDLMKAVSTQSEFKKGLSSLKEKLVNLQALKEKKDSKYQELKNQDENLLSNLSTLRNRIPELIADYISIKKEFENHLQKEPQKVNEEEIKQNSGSRLDSLQTQEKVLVKEMQLCATGKMMVEQETAKLEEIVKTQSEVLMEEVKESKDIAQRNNEIQGEIDHLLHLNNSSDLLAQRSIIQKTMEEKAEIAKKAQSRAEACKRLLLKTQEAERISLESAVCEINTMLATILKQLFTSIPISVEIKTTKELKSKKGQYSQRFDIPIFYGQNHYKSYKQLSGGEKDRLSLGITMALSEKFGGSILFLDETLHSLDPEVKGNAIATLKEFSSRGRTVLVAAHEETEGFYDRVIPLQRRR